jgi:hypothetical protein
MKHDLISNPQHTVSRKKIVKVIAHQKLTPKTIFIVIEEKDRKVYIFIAASISNSPLHWYRGLMILLPGKVK